MRLATRKDRAKVVEVLRKAFEDNPTMHFMTGDFKKEKQIAAVMKYAFDFAIRRQGVYISDNEKGVAIYFKYNYRRKDLLDLFYQIRLVVTALPLFRLRQIFEHLKKVNQLREGKPHFLYVWFIGVDPEEYPRTSPTAFKKRIFDSAKQLHLDIYAETTRRELKIGYERLGFQVYKKWYNAKNGLNVWFLKKPIETIVV